MGAFRFKKKPRTQLQMEIDRRKREALKKSVDETAAAAATEVVQIVPEVEPAELSAQV